MPLIQITRRHLLAPRRNLGAFIKSQAERAQTEHGFGYVPLIDAPSTYPALLAVYSDSAASGRPYPVSAAHCEETIFEDPETNWAMRFVHDLEHATNQLCFSTEDELIVGMHHLEALRAAGYGPDTLEHKLLHADTVGQTYCMALLGRFPYNQRLFVYDCLDLGVDAAVELEAECTRPAA